MIISLKAMFNLLSGLNMESYGNTASQARFHFFVVVVVVVIVGVVVVVVVVVVVIKDINDTELQVTASPNRLCTSHTTCN